MNDVIDYKKACSTSNEPTGAIMIDNYLGKPTYTAEKFMSEFGYIKCN